MYNTFVLILEIIGTIAFAISGAMTAIERKLDVLGVVILGSITACAGGFMRDVCLGEIPHMFIRPIYVIVASLSSLIMFIICYIKRDISMVENQFYKNTMNITDAIGLGIFVVIGANKTIQTGFISFFIVTFMATLTAVGGGILRDMCVNKIPNVFRKHLYAVPTILGGIIYYIMLSFKLNQYLSMATIVIFISAFRMLAYKFELSLPRVIFKEEKESDFHK